MKSNPGKKAAAEKRSQSVSVVLDSKLRYLAEIAARKHRRSVSNYIEWAVADSFHDMDLGGLPETPNHIGIVTLADKSNYLWDVYESDRFVKFASDYPNLLTHEEQILVIVMVRPARLELATF